MRYYEITLTPSRYRQEHEQRFYADFDLMWQFVQPQHAILVERYDPDEDYQPFYACIDEACVDDFAGFLTKYQATKCSKPAFVVSLRWGDRSVFRELGLLDI